MGCEGYLTMIKLKCPICGAVWYRESLEAVLKEVEEMWKCWEDSMTEEQKQMVRKHNNLEKLQKSLDKNGYITVFCQACRLFVTIKAMKNISITYKLQQGIGG